MLVNTRMFYLVSDFCYDSCFWTMAFCFWILDCIDDCLWTSPTFWCIECSYVLKTVCTQYCTQCLFIRARLELYESQTRFCITFCFGFRVFIGTDSICSSVQYSIFEAFLCCCCCYCTVMRVEAVFYSRL